MVISEFLKLSNSFLLMFYREKKNENLRVIIAACVTKLVTFVCLLTAFGLRFGPNGDVGMGSTILFFLSFSFEFLPALLHLIMIVINKAKCPILIFFHNSKMRALFYLLHLSVGVSLACAFTMEGSIISHREAKGLAGFYCILSSYTFFRTCRDIFQPTSFEMFGWFEVVFTNIIKLLAVSLTL